MGLLTYSINVTLDGCVDHREGIADDETHALYTRLLEESGAMLWGRTTYEMMEAYWPLVARGEVDAPQALVDWARTLEGKPKIRRLVHAHRLPLDQHPPPHRRAAQRCAGTQGRHTRRRAPR